MNSIIAHPKIFYYLDKIKTSVHLFDARALKSERLAFQSCLSFDIVDTLQKMLKQILNECLSCGILQSEIQNVIMFRLPQRVLKCFCLFINRRKTASAKNLGMIMWSVRIVTI